MVPDSDAGNSKNQKEEMTTDEYREKYGADLKKNASQPWYVALMQTLHDAHPLNKLTARVDGDKLEGATVLLNEIGGYQKCLEVLVAVSTEKSKEAPEVPSEYPDQKE